MKACKNSTAGKPASTAHETALATRPDLAKYGKNARLLFALELRLQVEDVHTVAVDALTESPEDKKCDLVYVDRDRGYLAVAQGYESQNSSKPSAPSNKAADLNTAAAWLLSAPLDDLPDGLRPAAQEARQALNDGVIRYVQFCYVHNLPESLKVREELAAVEQSVYDALNARFPNAGVVEVSAVEVGRTNLSQWYQALRTPILVADRFDVVVPGGYEISSGDWTSFVTAVPATWLYTLFKDYGDRLFSANVRGYLGSRKSTRNINNGIKQTAKEDPQHFWVYNNGITALVHDFQADSEHAVDGSMTFTVTGMSIVNGAQTTGALGSLGASPEAAAKVPARFVKCTNQETIQHIIEYNNRQNQVEAADFHSNDIVQQRLRDEFEHIPDASYSGGRRGGAEDIIPRAPNQLPSGTVAQALAAFHQNPVVAYNEKAQIWISDELYSRYFSEQTRADHIVFCFSLLRAIEQKKLDLLAESDRVGTLRQTQAEQLAFLRQRGAAFLLTAAIANCLETLLGQAVPNPFRASFGPSTSPDAAREIWRPIVEATVPFYKQLLPAIRNGINSAEDATRVIGDFSSFVEATAVANAAVYQQFARRVTLNV